MNCDLLYRLRAGVGVLLVLLGVAFLTRLVTLALGVGF